MEQTNVNTTEKPVYAPKSRTTRLGVRAEERQRLQATGKLECPKCSYRCDFPQAMGRHLSFVHGIAGKSHSSLWEQKRKAKQGRPRIKDRPYGKGGHMTIDAWELMQKEGNIKCPKCAYRCYDPRGLGVHLRYQHGIKGKSADAQRRQRGLFRPREAVIKEATAMRAYDFTKPESAAIAVKFCPCCGFELAKINMERN
jgi:DNA-directed RNA polymerase subunit RPC12/RpoP